MPRSTDWTREQTLAALHVYFQLPFGQLHQRNPLIQHLAEWIGRTSGSVALKLVNFASLDPQVRASGRAGMSNASRLDKQIWSELNSNWDLVADEAARTYEHYGSEHGVAPGADVAEDVPEIAEGKSVSATVKVRVNQARFRRAVLASYNARCCISGLGISQLLVASHILPWSMDEKNRLNPRNGLLLSSLHDKAYDVGLITVMPDFTIRVAEHLKDALLDGFAKETLKAFDGRSIRLPERFKPDPEFLASHASRFGFL
ncbi:MAG: HNH endonuclease [Hydrogenophaga sp.]|uniref:HNH endonuclease n=1 Tax=Hydrogenophaga sp. TaxID=1904254 RepID=UPI003D9B7B22